MPIDAIVVSPDSRERSRLREITKLVGSFRHMLPVGALADALTLLTGERNCDALYISSLFDEQVITDFIRNAKTSPKGIDSAYLLTLSANDSTGSATAIWLTKGIDAFLVEPFSVDDVAASTVLAMTLKKKRKDARETAALELLLDQAVNAIDTASIKCGAQLPYTASMKPLIQVNKLLKDVSPEVFTNYYEYAIERFGIALPTLKPDTGYTGSSKRVQARLIKKSLR